MEQQILNFIVYYDNPEEIDVYLKELDEIGHDTVKVYITVNKNHRRLIEKYQTTWEKAYNVGVFDFKNNIGYLNAMLYHLENIDFKKIKYVILSNTDIHYSDKDFFNVLLRKNYEETIGCIAPNVYEPQNRIFCNPHYKERISKQKYKRISNMFSSSFTAEIYLKLSKLKSLAKKRNSEEKSCLVYAPHGCYMIFSVKFVEILRGHRYAPTLYSEEAYIAEVLKKNEMKCYYDHDLYLEHMASTVTGGIRQKKRFALWKESIDYILREFYE